MMNPIEKPALPLPEPLSGSVFGSFAYDTVTRRMPRIAREVLEENELTPEVRGELENLIQDLPLSPIRRLRDVTAPDAEDWRIYCTPYLGQDWLSAPWFFAEIYFYRRILEAIGYFTPGPYQGYDPFLIQKAKALAAAEDAIRAMAWRLEDALESPAAETLRWMLVANIWGNQADLSMWSTDEEHPSHREPEAQLAHLLADDSLRVVERLYGGPGDRRRVDFVLDNYGPELAHDLTLADYLLSTGLVPRVYFHAKPHPYYVSDAMVKDIHVMLDWLASRSESAVRGLGMRSAAHLRAGRLNLVDDFFWTSPLNFWEMPARIRRSLGASDLVISKGDANYRRLAGDRNWPPTTPFADVVGYFQAPLLALRVIKAELALGLTAEMVAELNSIDPDWMINGNWGVIQLFSG
jgi:hypothetical protein